MKAMTQERFGPPDVLRLADVDVPKIRDDEVLVRVHAAALNPYDWHMLRGDPYIARLMGGVGFTRPKNKVAGIDAAGRVEAVGADVREFKPGDEVLGFCPGAFAEYASAKAHLVARKPEELTFEQAAAIPMAAVTALRGVRDVGRVQAGQRVLIIGAGGGVGTFAVQLTHALGAEVIAVCSARNSDLVESLGAKHVIDYEQQDFTAGDVLHEVIFDNVGNQPLGRLRQALDPTGTLVANGGGSPGSIFGPIGGLLRMLLANRFARQQLRPILPSVPDGPADADLRSVIDFVERGELGPVIDRTYRLTEVAAGVRYIERGHARGKAVVTV